MVFDGGRRGGRLMNKMNRNVHGTERWIRVAAGLVLMTLGFTLPLPLLAEEIAEIIGLLAVVTGATGYCPIKRLVASAKRPRNREQDSGGAPEE